MERDGSQALQIDPSCTLSHHRRDSMDMRGEPMVLIALRHHADGMTAGDLPRPPTSAGPHRDPAARRARTRHARQGRRRPSAHGGDHHRSGHGSRFQSFRPPHRTCGRHPARARRRTTLANSCASRAAWPKSPRTCPAAPKTTCPGATAAIALRRRRGMLRPSSSSRSQGRRGRRPRPRPRRRGRRAPRPW